MSVETQALLSKSFFDEQRRRKRQTYLFLGLGLVWMAIMGCLIVAVHESILRMMAVTPAEIRQWCLISTVAVVGVWALLAGVLLRWASRFLPLLMGARPADGVDERTLKQVTAEIPIAAGEFGGKLRWYVMETDVPNAFACGRSVGKGSIVVTRGLLDRVNRDELQAVVAHELAHLQNGDAQFIVAALAFAWMVVGASIAACIGLAVAAAVLALGLMAVIKIAEAGDGEWVGIVVGLLAVAAFIYGLVLLAAYALTLALVLVVVAVGVKAASSSISQSREYLADACAAQWTRNPLALASALAKISDGPRLATSTEQLVAPLWFNHPAAVSGDGFRQQLLSFLLHTHPDIEQRMVRLRSMAGSTAITDGRWLLDVRLTTWQRTKEWLLPTCATLLAAGLMVVLVHDLFQ